MPLSLCSYSSRSGGLTSGDPAGCPDQAYGQGQCGASRRSLSRLERKIKARQYKFVPKVKSVSLHTVCASLSLPLSLRSSLKIQAFGSSGSKRDLNQFDESSLALGRTIHLSRTCPFGSHAPRTPLWSLAFPKLVHMPSYRPDCRPAERCATQLSVTC